MATSIKREPTFLPLNGHIALVGGSPDTAPANAAHGLGAFVGAVVGSLKEAGDVARAALIGTAPLAPLVAAIVAIATAAGPVKLLGLEPISFAAALVDLAIGWAAIALAWALLGFTDVRRANTTTYCELATQLKTLQAARETVCNTTQWKASTTGRLPAASRARMQFEQYLDEVENALVRRRWGRSVWVLGTGYLSAWQLIHRAHEALIEVEPLSSVLLRATYDRLRLAGARLQNGEELRAELETVLKRFDTASTDASASAQVPTGDMEEPTRRVVGIVRQTLNEFRDENLAGLMRSRIQLGCSTMNTGLLMYAVLWLALAAGLHGSFLVGGMAYFLVGAVVGLVSRMRADFDSDTAIDDFGLSAMRHFAAPQLSGIAAVLGVSVLAITGITEHTADPLGNAFNFLSSPMNLVTAAVFGLTPALLIDRLHQQSDTFKQNLRSTDPQSGSK